ncbi:Hypothetical protein UVM_LOCUS185, partial [uncultured virus]
VQNSEAYQKAVQETVNIVDTATKATNKGFLDIFGDVVKWILLGIGALVVLALIYLVARNLGKPRAAKTTASTTTGKPAAKTTTTTTATATPPAAAAAAATRTTGRPLPVTTMT